MEKLKNLVNPGSKKDDEVMYGSGRSDDPVHTGHTHMGSTNAGSGQGSHFGGSRTAGHDSLSTSSNLTGVDQHERGNTTGVNQYDAATAPGASHGLSEPYASRMPGGFDNDDAATTASVSSGVPGQSQSRSSKSAVNDPTFIEKPLPREPASGTGNGRGQSSLTGNIYPHRSVVDRSRHGDPSGSPRLGRDAAVGAGASAHRYEDPQRDNYTPETDRSFPLGGSSVSDGYGSTTTGPDSSNLANKADPRIDSDGSHTTGNTGYGSRSDAHSSTTAGPHSSNFANKADPRTTVHTGYGSISSDYHSGTGATPVPGNQGSLSRDLGAGAGAGAVGSGRTGDTGYESEFSQHEHPHHGHHFEGDPFETGEVGGREGPHFVSGPHVTDTANRLDPHVGSDFAGATGDSSGHHHHGQSVHRGEEVASAGGAGAAGLGALETDHRKLGTTGNTTPARLESSSVDRHGINTTGGDMYDNNHGTTTGVSSTGKTAGPHKSDMLNKLDPRVDSDLSKQQGSHGSDHHFGRDAALTGAGGTSMREAEKHHRDNVPHVPTSTTTSGIGERSHYGSSADALDTSRSGMASDEFSSAGRGHQPAATISEHHFKRDAGLVGAGGVGAYAAEKHHGLSDRSDLTATPQDRLAGSGHQPAIDSSYSSYPSTSYGSEGQTQTGAHTERDPLAAGVTGAKGTGGGDKAQGMDSEKGHHISHHTGRDAALEGGAGAGTSAGHEYSQKGTARYGHQPYHIDSPAHHTGRDTAVGGVAVTGAAPHEQIGRRHHAGQDTVAVGGAGAGHESSQRDGDGYSAEAYRGTSREHHTGRDAAILGGAAGVGGLAEHENSKKDTAKLQKEHGKEEKALEKQHSKEIKYHNKELAKEEKAHEMANEKSEKKHDNAIDKDERKYEKAIEKDETKQEHGGKKHGGLLGFLHRDKPDKELKEEEVRGQAATHPGRGEEEFAAGASATGLESRRGYDPLQEDHGSQSGVHDSPIGIGSGPTTHDAYGAHDSGHNKLHKDPPAKVVESRGYEFH